MDDIVFGSTSQQLVEQFVGNMSTEFEMRLVKELTYFLSLQVRQTDSGIFISQVKYAKNLLNKFRLGLTKYIRTLIGTHEKIARDEVENGVDQTLYISMIRSLLYLIASCPDLCYSVGVCARYQASPKASQLIAVRKIIKYVSGTTDYNLWYT